MAKKVRSSDFDHVAQYVVQEYKRRKKNRKSLDYQIREIDRQVEMRPDISHKLNRFGQKDPTLTWLPEIELPLQAEALETLMSDAREMLFPDAGPWYTVHADTTDDYYDNAEGSISISGDEANFPFTLNQDNVNKIVSGYIDHWHRQYDFRGYIDLINAEAFSYGTGIGRARMVTKSVIQETARGMASKKKRFPVLIPRSLKETYLDDRQHITMREGYMVGPMTIFTRQMTLSELKKTAKSNDPKKPDGGWISKNLNRIEPDKDGLVEILEAEGDFVIPRKSTGAIFSPGTIFTIAHGKNDPVVIRMQFKDHQFDSVLVFPYHKERMDSAYSTGPLRKGRALQAMTVESLMRLVETSALRARPPVKYDRSDMWFAEEGGPVIEPGALWGTLGDVVPIEIGDPTAMFTIYGGMLQQYADSVGVHRARLGAQTLSHTTAFAKNAELQRGAVRTVDYVRSTLQGPLTKWLQMCYEMARANFAEETIFLDASGYKGFVTLTEKDALPEGVVFEAHGSGGPAEEAQKRQDKLAALQQALQMDQINVQMGGQPTVDLPAMIADVLQDGGWADVDTLLNSNRENPEPSPEMVEALNAEADTQ